MHVYAADGISRHILDQCPKSWLTTHEGARFPGKPPGRGHRELAMPARVEKSRYGLQQHNVHAKWFVYSSL
jgi:hypothetical protein